MLPAGDNHVSQALGIVSRLFTLSQKVCANNLSIATNNLVNGVLFQSYLVCTFAA